jgi:primase-polymerase (primpol)-like protein
MAKGRYKEIGIPYGGAVDGIGFIFTKSVGITGIDLDHCVTNKLLDWAGNIIKYFDSYAEISTSGDGIHILIEASKAGARCRKDLIEIYDADRFLVITGNKITPPNITPNQKKLDAFYNLYFPPITTNKIQPVSTQSMQSTQSASGSFEDVLSVSKDDDKFIRLMKGDTSGYASHSEADMALIWKLVFYLGDDTEQILNIFTESQMYRDLKYGRRKGFLIKLIEDAIGNHKDRFQWATYKQADRNQTVESFFNKG